MASNFWIKLYHEILHDPKMGKLPDNVWRRAIELFLLAGELDDGGKLPDTEDLSWHLHRPSMEELETELAHLEKVGILTRLEGGWLVTKFSERQKAIGDAERAKAYRDRKRRQIEPETHKSNGSDTPELQERHEPVTKRDTDIDIDKDILPNGNSGKPPKAKKVSRENDKETPTETLLPNTPEARLLFAKINRNRTAKDRNQAKRFGSLEQKQKCLAAASRLGYEKFSEGIEAGLTNGITDIKGLVNWIAKYTGNGPSGSINRHTDSPRASPKPVGEINLDTLRKLQEEEKQ